MSHLSFRGDVNLFFEKGCPSSIHKDSSGERSKEPNKDDTIVGKKRESSTSDSIFQQRRKKQSAKTAGGKFNDLRTLKESDLPAVRKYPFLRSDENAEKDSVKNGEILHVAAIDRNLIRGEDKGGITSNDRVPTNADAVDQEDKESEEDKQTIEKESEEDSLNKDWNDFVNNVGTSEKQNLEDYLKTKETRRRATTAYANDIDKFMMELRKLTNTILSEIVAPVCNKYSERIENIEEDIIKTMVSNNYRRNKLLELMNATDIEWRKTHTTLLEDVLGDKENCDNVANDQKVILGEDRPGTTQTKTRGGKSPDDKYSHKNEKETVIVGQDPDWETLIEHEPSRQRILSFLDQREQVNCTRDNFGEIMDEVHVVIEAEVRSILDTVGNLFHQSMEACRESEGEIENLIMENYGRQRNLREELEKNEREAKERFAALRSRLG